MFKHSRSKIEVCCGKVKATVNLILKQMKIEKVVIGVYNGRLFISTGRSQPLNFKFIAQYALDHTSYVITPDPASKKEVIKKPSK